MLTIEPRQRESLRLLWREGRLSRWELHEKTGLNPNAVGVDVAALLSEGIVRECQTSPSKPGRPRVPLEIDPYRRHVVGLAVMPGNVEACRLNLRGELMGEPIRQAVAGGDANLVPEVARELFDRATSPQSLAVGLSTTGFIDQNRLTFSSTLPGRKPVSLRAIYDAAGDLPIVLENDMHALGARWLLTHQAEASEDALLVCIQDGLFGAALLIDGRPNRGCATGANELGHNQFPVETEPCYCGHTGCLERICSSAFLRAQDGAEGKEGGLMQRAAAYDGSDQALGKVIQYVALGLANAVNLIRPNRLVLVSELTRYTRFSDTLLDAMRQRLLAELAQRVLVDLWDQPATRSAETAGWLALANLYRDGWSPAEHTPGPPGPADREVARV